MAMDIKESLRNPTPTTIIIGVLCGLMFYIMPSYGAELLVIAISFLIADILPLLFIRGGNKIFQIGQNTRTQPKGYAFIAFFSSIIFTSIFAEALLTIAVSVLTTYFQNITLCLGIGLGLSASLYLDMNRRFYGHSRKT
jgi:hypothetical protein